MSLDATGLDSPWATIVVVFNGTEDAVEQRVPDLPVLRLHPVLVESADPVLRTASAAADLLSVPPRSVAVFVSDAS